MKIAILGAGLAGWTRWLDRRANIAARWTQFHHVRKFTPRGWPRGHGHG